MRNVIALIAASFIFVAMIATANADSDKPVLIEMSHDEAAALIDSEMGNWTGDPLGAWVVGHAYEYTGSHGFFNPKYNPVYVMGNAKSETLPDENGFMCSRTITTIDVAGKLREQTNGIAARICVKGDVVTVEITTTVHNKAE